MAGQCYPLDIMSREELLSRISVDPNICFGKPCIRGHRMPSSPAARKCRAKDSSKRTRDGGARELPTARRLGRRVLRDWARVRISAGYVGDPAIFSTPQLPRRSGIVGRGCQGSPGIATRRRGPGFLARGLASPGKRVRNFGNPRAGESVLPGPSRSGRETRAASILVI